MRLNHLEIAGFKSFPERAELAFDGGVTAIVGPNGCGKSNVIDAITWVLGEQSARRLRGGRMEDVIFGGSDARRPTAAAEVRLRLADVSAVLAVLAGELRPAPLVRGSNGEAGSNGHGAAPDENDHGDDSGGAGGAGAELVRAGPGRGIAAESVDADPDGGEPDPRLVRADVEVGRRLYRSGESEYFIDGQVCRLRDVQDLLMDSGVGVKAYAVIEQGRIGQILGARPTERRQLLEEAAGVTKYKSRRRTAELKLEAAQQNLTRVDDIVFEVEKQRGALKRQAARARRYRRLREELRRWERVYFTRRSVALRAAIEESDRQLDESRARERAALASVTDAVDDWSSGTRIGKCLRDFNADWSRRVLGQGALVLFISDGLDRDEGHGLEFEIERLHKSCRRLVWLNPLLRYERYEAKAAGARSLIRHVDDARTIHNLESMSDLAATLAKEWPKSVESGARTRMGAVA